MAVVIALMVGVVTVVGQYEHGVQVADEAAASSRAATLAKKNAFIAHLAPYAQTLKVNYGVLPSITIAQAILESNWGTSTLAAKYHNLFGVKAKSNQAGQELTTQEYENGKWVTVTARFRSYTDDYASMREHAQLLAHGTTWNAHQYVSVIRARDYQAAATALQKSGYATDPQYAQKIIRVVEQYHLEKYDGTK
jgi:flagellum-specific peptidoglycan hydrolase FlgJ